MGNVVEPSQRNPLKCPACKNPYLTSTGAGYPAQMGRCKHTMCVRCVKEKWKLDEKKSIPSLPYTVECSTCATVNYVAEEPVLMLYLIEMIEEMALHYDTEESAAKMETTEMTSFKCPSCNASYGDGGELSPHVLYCGHMMCSQCVKRNKTINADRMRPHTIKCSICSQCTTFKELNSVSELTEIKTYLDLMKIKSDVRSEFVSNLQKSTNTVVCWDCKKVVPLEESIACDCQPGNPEYVICLFCATVKHKQHGTTAFLREKLEQQSEKLVKKAESSIDHCSSIITAIMHGHDDAVDDFRRTLRAKVSLAESKDTMLDANKVLRRVDEITRQFTATMQTVIDDLGKAEAKMMADLLEMRSTQ